jgi:hypothetical protein
MASTMKKTVNLIEAIPKEDKGQDAPILTEFLKMAGWSFEPHQIKGHTAEQQKKSFLGILTRGDSRFIHISAHGDEDGGLAIGNSGVNVSGADIASYCRTRGRSSKPLKGRFVTLSACGEISGRFPLELNEVAGATAVISPLVEVTFAESAVFMLLFYFSLAKSPKLCALSSSCADRSQARTSRRIAHYIDSFQRTKLAYLSIGGAGAFRLDYWWQNEHTSIH